ncbi:MAG: PucR family transcriptional regulator [Solirubrobacterales bacterium]
MDEKAGKGRQSRDAESALLAERLRARQGEIERALTHVCTTSGAEGVQDAEYTAGLENAFAAALQFTLECIESGREDRSPLPPAAVVQAQRAARYGIGLDAFLVGVIESHSVLNEFVLAEAGDLTAGTLGEVQSLQTLILRRLASGLARDYKREEARLAKASDRRQVMLVERLLSGSPVADHEVGYILNMWHIALIASGTRPLEVTRVLAEQLGTALLTVPRGAGTIWAWLGSRRRISSELVRETLAKRGDVGARFAVGEPGCGVEGWRETHFEAKAALAVALRRQELVTCFSTVALESIALQTPDLARSLQTTFLEPLTRTRDRGSILRQTLRAYFASGRNTSSAAASLGVTRRTVENRMRVIEGELGRPVNACSAELELALRLDALGPMPASEPAAAANPS